MKTKHYAMTAIIGYLFFLLILTPASTVVSFLDLPPKKVALHGVSGTIWSGMIDRASFNKQQLQAISWSLNPLSLLTGSLTTALEASVYNNTVNTRLHYSYFSDQLKLTDLQSNINAKDLQQQLNLPFGELAGDIRIKFDQIEIIPNTLPSINGLISWTNARLTLAEKISLGNIFLRLEPGANNEISGKLSNTNGDLSINGDIKVSAQQIYTLHLRLKPRANASDELLSIVRLIAPRKKNNEHVLTRSGHLRQLGIKL